eukprot:8902509-Alexandrium_andersonii.AAC.1
MEGEVLSWGVVAEKVCSLTLGESGRLFDRVLGKSYGPKPKSVPERAVELITALRKRFEDVPFP